MDNNTKLDTQGSTSNTQTTHGPQGVDKAPGEEAATAPDQFLQETQKGKKVDADVSQQTDQPTEQKDF